jgi:hypothetical protein
MDDFFGNIKTQQRAFVEKPLLLGDDAAFRRKQTLLLILQHPTLMNQIEIALTSAISTFDSLQLLLLILLVLLLITTPPTSSTTIIPTSLSNSIQAPTRKNLIA